MFSFNAYSRLYKKAFSLNLNFPKRTFRNDDEKTNNLSLEDAGLHPQAVLFIQNLDA